MLASAWYLAIPYVLPIMICITYAKKTGSCFITKLFFTHKKRLVQQLHYPKFFWTRTKSYLYIRSSFYMYTSLCCGHHVLNIERLYHKQEEKKRREGKLFKPSCSSCSMRSQQAQLYPAQSWSTISLWVKYLMWTLFSTKETYNVL